jgi:signal transduction histidine kinase
MSLAVVFACMCGASAFAAEFATKAEAEAMVKKGVAFIKASGKDKAYAEMNRKDGQFTDRDLYLAVYGVDGVVRAHGANPKMIGKNLIELKDVDMAKKGAPFWQEYKFNNPVSARIEPKVMYCQPLEDVIVCGGVYIK